MSNLTKPPILDDTGQDILSALADIKRNLPQGGGSNGYAPTDATEATLADDDKMPFYDASASGKRNSTWANIKAKLKAYFDTIYSTFSGAYADLTGKPDLTVYMQKGVDYVTAGQISGQTIGTDATAEGHDVNAYGIYSHAEGDSTSAANNQAHAEGYYTNAMGVNSHAEGFGTKALGANSHAEGKYNVGITGALHEIGNGTNDQNRKNVFVVMDSGKVFASDGDADIGSYADNSDNRMLTYGNTNGTVSDMDGKIRIELTEAEFNQLTQAQKDDPRITYYVTDKPSLGYPVQDDGSATDLTDGALATGRTLESWLLKRFTPVRLGVKIPATANTWDTMYLSEPISNYAMLWFRAVQYGNTLGGISEPVALFKTHTGTGNRILWKYDSMIWQAYYVNDTQISVVQSTVSGSIYQTEVWGIGRLV